MILKKFHSKNGKKGFTLVEMLVVMVILALLAALVGPRLFPKLGKGKASAAKAQNGQQSHRQDCDHPRLVSDGGPAQRRSAEV